MILLTIGRHMISYKLQMCLNIIRLYHEQLGVLTINKEQYRRVDLLSRPDGWAIIMKVISEKSLLGDKCHTPVQTKSFLLRLFWCGI